MTISTVLEDVSRTNLALGGVATLGASLIWYLGRNGMLKKISASRVKYGPYVIIYTDHVGPYKDVGKHISRVHRLLKQHKIQSSLSCGFYFDDPDKVPAKECRASVGKVVFEGLDTNGLAKAKKDLQNHPIVTEAGLKVGTLPEVTCMSIEFPFRSLFSILIGAKRCYPELFKHVDMSQCVGSFELYDKVNKKMYFTIPLDSREDFQPFDEKKES